MAENNSQPRNPPQNLKTVVTHTEISGPIPPPQVLQQYNSIVPNAAERIIRMAEKQSDHRIDLERKVVDSSVVKSYLGMASATCIALYGLYIAKEISVHGHPWAAGIIAALDLGGIIYVAISNGSIQSKERQNRRDTSSTIPTVSKKN